MYNHEGEFFSSQFATKNLLLNLGEIKAANICFMIVAWICTVEMIKKKYIASRKKDTDMW